MPSFLSDIFSEPINLAASESSPYDPPQLASNEKTSSRSTSTTDIGTGHVPNGSPVDNHRNNKFGTGVLSGGSYIVNTNLQNNSLGSLPNGRSSGSIHSRDRVYSQDGNTYTLSSGLSPGESGRKSPGPVNGLSRPNEGQMVSLNGNIMQSPKARVTESTATSSTERSAQTRPPSSPIQNRHRRAVSASSPNGSTSLPASLPEPTKLDTNRLSSPPANELSSPTSLGGSSTLTHPGLIRLQHRHTLQVPRLSTTRNSRDLSSSDEAYTTAVSPTTAARRGSLSLVRRTTRSIHSDVYLDEIPQDGEVARWTENVRQKRASRRKRKEEEEDDRVMVGTKVDQHHVNWVTAYNMLTGIRFTVSRTNAKLDRELTDQDFDAKHKFSFDITGNELTPSAKYDFKFKDYAPLVFRHLRAKFQLDPADYLISLTSKYILSELGSPGKSGSFFYFSRDYKYIIKTIHHAEHKLLRKILRNYYAHVEQNPNTLISQFYGLHRVKIPYGRKIHFVVMNNLFPAHRDIHQTFDLKGSTIGRDFKEEDLENNPRATLKDLNWLRRNYHLEFGPEKKKLFIEQMKKDVALLQSLKIMDYSLLVGIHDLNKGNEEKLRDKTLQVFEPAGERSEEPQPNMLLRTPSKLENIRKARELRQIIKREKPVPMDRSTFQMPEEDLEEGRKNFLFYSDDGGLRATHEDGQPGDEIYYLGIIDCLTHYGFTKKAEHFWKGLSHNKSQISPIPAQSYGDRFVKFITATTMTKEEAEKHAHDHDQVDGVYPLGRTSSNQYTRTSAERVMEKAERQARQTETRGANEDEVPERILSTNTARSPSPERGGMTLPILEEVGEGGSTGGRSAHSREAEESRGRDRDDSIRIVESEEPGTPEHRSMFSPPLGGRPPPTPPKDFVPRNKVLPSLPRFTDSPAAMSPER